VKEGPMNSCNCGGTPISPCIGLHIGLVSTGIELLDADIELPEPDIGLQNSRTDLRYRNAEYTPMIKIMLLTQAVNLLTRALSQYVRTGASVVRL